LIDIEIEDPAWSEAEGDAEALARRAAEAVLLSEGADGEHVTVLLTDDDTFPAPPNPEKHLGDVALAFGTCAREAGEQGKPLAHHLQHLVAHGVLHLLGYDHMTDQEAEAMEGLERVVLAGLGVPDPYAAGEGDHG
jgi:probable rRNA maturation factor